MFSKFLLKAKNLSELFRRVQYRVLQQLKIDYLPCSNANHDNFLVSLYLVASKKTVFKRVLFAKKKATAK